MLISFKQLTNGDRVQPRAAYLLVATSGVDSLCARARRLGGNLFARAQRQRAFRRYGPDFHRRAVVQTRKIFGDLCSLLEATDLEQEKATDRFFGFGKRAVRDGTARSEERRVGKECRARWAWVQ